jgi:CTP synthase
MLIYERHRHRYEFNNTYKADYMESGFVISGVSPDERLVEIIELPDHPWFLAVQFHPEFKSRPTHAHPLFREFIKAAKSLRD